MIRETKAPCFIQLGRYGDLILLFPAFKAIYDRTGARPVVLVSTEYASVFEGISYAVPVPVEGHWWQGIPEARRRAEAEFGEAIIPQWWHECPKTHRLEAKFRGDTLLNCHGYQWGVNAERWPDFMTSMFERAGFTRAEMKAWPVLFDQRDAGREKLLVKAAQVRRDLPLLLVNFSGISSPFPWMPEVMAVVNQYARRFHILDLGKIRAWRIYDLLGLFDVAVGMITIDTATLHLAGTGNVEYVAYTRGDWAGSVPKGQCVLEMEYPTAGSQTHKLLPILERWAA